MPALAQPEPVLKAGRLYLAYDRVVCAHCAGMTALYTGLTIGGAVVEPVRVIDVAEWATYDLGPLCCEGGHLEAHVDDAGALVVTEVTR